jgi:hypothetical protein
MIIIIIMRILSADFFVGIMRPEFASRESRARISQMATQFINILSADEFVSDENNIQSPMIMPWCISRYSNLIAKKYTFNEVTRNDYYGHVCIMAGWIDLMEHTCYVKRP